MTDNTENTTQVEGVGGQPTAPASTTQGGTSSPVGVVTLEDLNKAVRQLTGEVNALKSDKDKGVAKVATKVQNLEEVIKQYEKYRQQYENPDKALREMKVDELLAGKGSGELSTDVPPGRGGNQSPAASATYSELLSAFGLNANDAEVVNALDPDDPWGTTTRLTSISNKRKQPAQAAPNPASMMPTTSGSSVPAPDDLQSITAELKQLMRDPFKNMKRIDELSAQQKKLLPTK